MSEAPAGAVGIPPEPPAVAAAVFGDRLELAESFVAILADTGVSQVAEAMPTADASVIDVGSGAGLPGLALAIARPDLRVTLVEPMLRRTTWLSETVAALGLSGVEVCRGRAEEFHGRLSADYVTARAVAALDKLAGWCAPLTRVGGELVLMKGDNAADELAAAAPVLSRWGLGAGQVRVVGQELPTPTTLVVIGKEREPAATKRRGKRR